MRTYVVGSQRQNLTTETRRKGRGGNYTSNRRFSSLQYRVKSEERNRWDIRYTESPGSWTEPDDFLKRAYDEFLSKIPAGWALDLAGGAGRNALFLAQRGWQVRLVDISEVGLGLAEEKARAMLSSGSQPPSVGKQAYRVSPELMDLNTVTDLGSELYDLIIVFYFLRRELFPAIVRALKPGGFLIYRTYTIDRMKVPDGPDDPKYLLQPNELLRAFSALRILHYHETTEGKAAAGLVAAKSSQPSAPGIQP